MKHFLLSAAALLLCGMFLLLPSSAFADSIDLTDFYLEGDGIVSADSARLEIIDPGWDYSLLVNDPMWGDPGIGVSATAETLSFSYSFNEDAAGDTDFYVRLFDGINGDLIADYLVTDSADGDVSFDLATLLTGQTLLGMDFTLTEYNFGTTGSWVEISDLEIYDPIPEPGTIMLFGMGLIALIGRTRKK